jgi:hypothetical protein
LCHLIFLTWCLKGLFGSFIIKCLFPETQKKDAEEAFSIGHSDPLFIFQVGILRRVPQSSPTLGNKMRTRRRRMLKWMKSRRCFSSGTKFVELVTVKELSLIKKQVWEVGIKLSHF